MSNEFSKFRILTLNAKKVKPFVGTVLALDPGETTGWCVFNSTVEMAALKATGQIKTWEMVYAVENLGKLLKQYKPDIVVHETYAVYSWKAQDHSWSQVPTLRVIGCLETLCIQNDLRYHDQTAQVAKHFVTDDKLKRWGFYQEGMKHARDAIRHGCYFLCFGLPTNKRP